MNARRISRIAERIKKIKEELKEMGPMRPGTLSRQYKSPQKKTGAYWPQSVTNSARSPIPQPRKARILGRGERWVLPYIGALLVETVFGKKRSFRVQKGLKKMNLPPRVRGGTMNLEAATAILRGV